ncbi:glucosamine-fructose-6-phosphate aminotransferase [Moniliophthora roreri]|nr:glucosamine-fructose-6-phosphate aminotransferase [Moniliophthora roreri]
MLTPIVEAAGNKDLTIASALPFIHHETTTFTSAKAYQDYNDYNTDNSSLWMRLILGESQKKFAKPEAKE